MCWEMTEAILPCLQSGASPSFSLVAHIRSVKVKKNQVLQRERLPILISILRLGL